MYKRENKILNFYYKIKILLFIYHELNMCKFWTTQAQRLLTVIPPRDAGFDRNNRVECSSVFYVPDRAKRNYPGLDLEMLNSLTTRGARHSACQLPAQLGLTARSWDSYHGAPAIAACFHLASTANDTARIADRW